MRDIRKDLEERLEEIAVERGQLQRRLVALDDKESTVKTMLATEEARWASQQPLPGMGDGIGPDHRPRSPVVEFALKALGDGQERSLVQLKRLALEMGVDFGAKKPGRVLHFTLAALSRHGIVEKTANGGWKRSNNTED